MNYKKANRVYVVLSLQRTGHHAIIEWIKESIKGDTLFLNDCGWWNHSNGVYGVRYNDAFGDNPYHTAYNFWYNNEFYNEIPVESNNIPQNIDNLIINFEEFDVDQLKTFEPIEKTVNSIVSEYKDLRLIIVSRDPFNLSASRDVGSGGKNKLDIKEWKKYYHKIKELEKFNFFTHIDFTIWTEDYKYRYNKSKELKLDKFIAEVEFVIPHGGGSSFDKGKKLYSDIKDNINNRWLGRDNTDILKDTELVDMCKDLYGKEFVEKIENEHIDYS